MLFPDDAVLISKFRAGDQKSFTVIHEKYCRRLYGYCYRLLLDELIAEDVVQDTFIKAFETLSSLEKPDQFYAWLFTIARNKVYGFLRNNRTNGRAHITGDEGDVWDPESPHTLLVQKETSQIVVEMMNQLKPEYREVLILRQYDKLSYAEIAAITCNTVSSVESRLFKARKALATKLGPYFK